jgi:phospholipid/cholesterol/gamma-HCH transport system permease protein
VVLEFVASSGRAVTGRAGRVAGWYGNRIRFVGAVVVAALRYQPTARPLLARQLINQLRFTAVQALPFLGLIGGLIGVTVVVQAYAAALFGMSDLLGRVLVAVVVRELGPILTAIVVIGRSGTAISAELATNGALGETEALEAMGVDPLQYFVIPRIVGGGISVALLTVYFVGIALLSGGALVWMLGQMVPAVYLESLRLALSTSDVWVMLLKGVVFGLGVVTLCSYEGLTGGRTATDVPQCVTRGVVASLAFVFLVSVVFSVALYM